MGVDSVNFTPVPKVSSAAAHTAAEVANPNASTATIRRIPGSPVPNRTTPTAYLISG